MKPAPGGAPISNVHGDDVERYSYTTVTPHVQVSRPSTLRTPAAASAAIALWQYDTRIWLKSPPGQPMLTLHQAAANLHVDVRTIQRLVEAGELLAVRFGPNTTRIPKSSYDELIARAVKRSLEGRAV